MLTLHPEPDEASIHGNVVGSAGVRHLALPWSLDHWLLLRPDHLAAELPRSLATALAPGEARSFRVLVPTPELELADEPLTVGRLPDGRWTFEAPAALGVPDVAKPDERGLPWSGGTVWPLEHE
jgi:hypothetical protein